tara:strand:+ start:960 stop:1475 length:516 start_codon:yes stop_codon:yes gene_type:complete
MTDLSAHDLARLQSALDTHRRKAERLGLPAENIRAIDLISKAKTDDRGRIICYASGVVLDFSAEAVGQPDKATIGHVFPLSAKRKDRFGRPIEHPGHTMGNVELESWASNSEQNNKQDTPWIAKGKRMSVDHDRPEQKSKWARPKVSALSKDHPNYRKPKWATTNTLRKKL